MAEDGKTILVVSDEERDTIKRTMYAGMKALDAAHEQSGGQGSDKQLADRAEAIYEAL